MKKILLFNPVSIVHARKMSIFRDFMPDWKLRCIYNPRFPWFFEMEKSPDDEIVYFTAGYFPRFPKNVFKDVMALVLFTAQPRIPSCNLIQEATMQKIPIIAIEEVYQMMLQQGMVNNYFLPVDHFLVASDYEREQFLKLGVSSEIMEVTGCMFANREYKLLKSPRKSKSDFDLSENKLTLTLCLDALSSEVQAPEISKKMVNCILHDLPQCYELLIKPHPADRKNDFSDLIRHAPKTKMADPKMPIDEILDVTDVLLNRGNSQVVIDALHRNIPVILIPLGKKTFFHGFLDEAILEDNNLLNVLTSVKARGMELYGDVFRKYLSISPEEAADNVISRIVQIAKNKELHSPEERLIELAIFWAWMGYVPMALKILRCLARSMRNNAFLEKIYRLITTRTGQDDVAFFKKQYRNTYREWIIQSLWIKALYLRNKTIGSEDKEWLTNYPPSMNRESFLPYVFLLYWCYRNSGMHRELDNLKDILCKESLGFPGLPEKGKLPFSLQYLISRIKYKGTWALKNYFLKNLPF